MVPYKYPSIFSAVKCNLNCKYCHIPKTPEIAAHHNEAVEWLRDGMIDDMLKDYGDELAGLSLWGTEPSITCDVIDWSRLFDTFPKLKLVKIPSNFIIGGDKYIDILKKGAGRNIDFQIQFSLDGPPEITDANRGKGTTAKVTKNIVEFVRKCGELGDVTVKIYAKPTLTAQNVEHYSTNLHELHSYFKFFDDVFGEISAVGSKNVSHAGSAAITLEIPGEYVTQDGKNWAKVVREAHRLKKLGGFKNITGEFEGYYSRFNRIAVAPMSAIVGTRCSAGRTSIGRSKDNWHICQRTFYKEFPEYQDNVLQSGRKDMDVDMILRDVPKILQKYYIQKEIDPRFEYTVGAFHQFIKFQIGVILTYLDMMILCGQVNEVYRDRDFATMLAMFIVGPVGCHADHLSFNGSLHLPTTNMVRMFANGAFEAIVDKWIEQNKTVSC